MANSIALAQRYVPLLDEVYKLACLTADLDDDPELAREGANANELIIPKMSMQGLGDYSRNAGYVHGDVTVTHETVRCGFDRGRMFDVDTMDDLETAGIAYGRLAGEFIRTKVAPELDAFRFAAYASADGIGQPDSGATLSAGADVIAALRAGIDAMDAEEVPLDRRYLYITPALYGLVQDMDTTKSREVFENFEKVIRVPQSRFCTAIKQLDGSSEGETDGGFVKLTSCYKKVTASTTGALEVVADSTESPTSSQIKLASVTPVLDKSYTPAVGDYVLEVVGKDINFMIIHKPAVIQFAKHVAPKIITPDMNPDADGYRFGYRHVGIAQVCENKLAGIYLHAKA